MRPFIFLFVLLMTTLTHSQEPTLEQSVNTLKENIRTSTSREKLKLLDSLSGLVIYNRALKYDSITKATIDLAFELEENDLATRHTGAYLYYLVTRTPRADEALQLFETFIKQDWKVTDTLALAWVYNNGADSYLKTGLGEASIPWYEKAENYAIKGKDSSLYALIKGYKGFALSHMGKFAIASQEYQKAIAVFNRRKDSLNILKVRIGLSILYGQNDFYTECDKEQEAIHQLSISLKEYGVTITNLGNRATNSYGQGDYKKSIYYNKQKLKLIEEYPQFKIMETSSLNTLVNCYFETDSLSQAHIYLKRLKAKLDLSNSDFNLKRQYKEALSKVYFLEKNYEKAKTIALELLELQRGSSNYEGLMKTNNFLSRIYKVLGNNSKAFTYYRSYTKIKDSIIAIKKIKALSYYQTLYETEKRDATIATQKAKITVLDKQNTIKRQWILFGGIGVFIFILFLFFRYRQKIKYKALENKLLISEVAHKNKDVKHLAISIVQNKEWAMVLADKIAKVRKTIEEKRTDELLHLEEEIKNKIFVDKSTDLLHEEIEKLGSSFFDKLKVQFPDLTKTELRLCSFLRMHMDTKQIAMLQNINPSSVKMSRNRLRKKLHLSPKDDLNAFLEVY